MTVKIFISYRRDDSAGYAGQIRDALEGEFGHRSVFMDVDSIPLGENFEEIICEEVTKCDVLLALIGPGWLFDRTGRRRIDSERDFPRLEIASAIKSGVRVVPVLLGGATIPARDELPTDLESLPSLNGIEVRNASSRADIQTLVQHITGRQAPLLTLILTLAALLGWTFLLLSFIMFLMWMVGERPPADRSVGFLPTSIVIGILGATLLFALHRWRYFRARKIARGRGR
jgi:hypothetical protein